ncbi:MAG: hypothetical protein AAGD25_11345 [Cyanobacteria bacterium P01_F01_bin.150]
MMATNTVTATLTDFMLPTAQVLGIKDGDWIHRGDRRKTLNHSFFALGCARAGLDILEQAASRSKASVTLKSTWTALDRQLSQCRTQVYKAQADVQAITDDGGALAVNHRLQLRAKTIDLAVRCTHAAVIVSKGAANTLEHPAQRVYREALAFSVFGQTPAIMDASLAMLCS